MQSGLSTTQRQSFCQRLFRSLCKWSLIFQIHINVLALQQLLDNFVPTVVNSKEKITPNCKKTQKCSLAKCKAVCPKLKNYFSVKDFSPQFAKDHSSCRFTSMPSRFSNCSLLSWPLRTQQKNSPNANKQKSGHSQNAKRSVHLSKTISVKDFSDHFETQLSGPYRNPVMA